MIVLCDFDGVLRDLLGGIITRLRNAGFEHTPEDFKAYNLSSSLKLEELKTLQQCSRDADLAEMAEWYPGAKDFLRTLQSRHDVYGVTAPWAAPEWDHATRRWASSHFPPERVLSVHAASKVRVAGDILIEDNCQTVLRWLAVHENGHAVLIDRPWNREGRDYQAHPRQHRARSYDQALTIIESL